MTELSKFLTSPEHSIRHAMRCIDENGQGIALVVDPERRLIGTVTDGDIRRAILHDVGLDLPVQTLLERRAATASNPAPLTAPAGAPDAQLIRLMNESGLRHIPLVEEDSGKVVDLALLSDLVKEYELPLTAVVMAGGLGVRLRPLTDEVPKPMLPVGEHPLLERIIKQLQQSGISRVNLTTHYKGDVIGRHFGNGQEFGVKISYVEERQPLGTAGALGLLDLTDEPLLVINGDILTRVDFRAMLHFHREHQADMTVAVRQYEFRIPYGVVESDGESVTGILEKPTIKHFINAGIYLVNPEMCRFIPNGQSYDMPDLITRLVDEGHRVVSFPVHEYWLDIGQIEDYQRAISDFANQEG